MRTLGCILMLAALAAAENLVENGGFESEGANWNLVPFSDQAQYDFDREEKAEGAVALRLSKAGGSKIDTAFVNFDLPAAGVDGPLKVSARVKAKGLGQGRLVFILYNGAGDIVLEKELHRRRLKKTFRWKRLEIEVEPPDDAVSGRVLLQVFRKGTLWLDDVSVDDGRVRGPVTAARGTNLLANGGFEAEREGWAFASFSEQAQYEFDRAGAWEGKVALRITKAGGAKVDTAFANFDLPPEHAGGKLAVSLQVKGAGLGGARLVFLLYDGSGGIAVNEELTAAPVQGDFDWKIAGGTFDTPDTAVSGRVLVQVLTGGKLWLDDVRVVPLGGAEEKTKAPAGALAVKNGDFDGSYSGWRRFAPAAVKTKIDRKTTAVGKGALRLERAGPRPLPVQGVETSVRAPRGLRRATLVFHARTEPATRAVAVLFAFDKRGAMLASARTEVEPGKDFAVQRLALEVPRGTDRLGIALGVEGAGKVWFDDVTLEK